MDEVAEEEEETALDDNTDETEDPILVAELPPLDDCEELLQIGAGQLGPFPEHIAAEQFPEAGKHTVPPLTN